MGIAVVVGNLPLCWPILRLALGNTEVSRTPSYHGDTISGSARKKRRRNPLGTMGASVMGTHWDKLEDQECCGERMCPQRVDSDLGSQIELALQADKHSYHHQTAASAQGSEEAEVQQVCPARAAKSTSGGGDNIMVLSESPR